MPRGQKECPKCKRLIGARSSTCKHCGEVMKAAKPRKKANPFYRERLAFIRRMLGGEKSTNFRLDITIATNIFTLFDNDIDFLSKVKPPFKFSGGITYLRSKAGRDYLTKKHREFYYNPENKEIFVEGSDKIGEDIVKPRIRSIRKFLNEREN